MQWLPFIHDVVSGEGNLKWASQYPNKALIHCASPENTLSISYDSICRTTDAGWLLHCPVIYVTGISVIKYGNWLALKPIGAWMIGVSDAREGAAGHVTVPEDRRKGDWLLRCNDKSQKEWNPTDELKRVLGGVSLHPCNLFHCLKCPHQSMNGTMDHSNDSSQGRSWALLEQRREASRSFSYEVRFNLRVQPSKRDDYTSMRQTPQQEEAQEWRRSTFWSRLVARRKLLAALQPSVNSRTKM